MHIGKNKSIKLQIKEKGTKSKQIITLQYQFKSQNKQNKKNVLDLIHKFPPTIIILRFRYNQQLNSKLIE
jgi:hypothetical protein